MRTRALWSCLAVLVVAACPEGPPGDDGGTDAGAASDDAGAEDAGHHETDAGSHDAGDNDAGANGDGGVDASVPDDGGHVDAGVDAGIDGGSEPGEDAGADGGAGDAGFDAGADDAGQDAGQDAGHDAGDVDGGAPPDDAGVGDTAAAYWGNTGEGLFGQALVDALHAKLAATHVVIPYGDLHDAYQTTDTGRGGCAGIFDFYSDQCWSSSDKCGNYSGEGDCYNREHSWPKSWWGGADSGPPYSDLFHVIPADGYVNNRRSNFPLGEVEPPYDHTSTNGSRVGACVDPAAGSTCFEPTDALKGDLARIYFYMAARYEGELGCCQRDAVDGADIKPWAEALLRAWHEADPVDDDERARNEAVYLLQGNRNPFVDFPSWVDLISDF